MAGTSTITVTGIGVSSGSVPYEYTPNAITVGANQLPVVRSGSMKNPRSATASAATGHPNGYQNIYFGTAWSNNYGGQQMVTNRGLPLGYDSRSGDFFPEFSVQLPVDLKAWDVLVSTISQPDAGATGPRPDYDPPSNTRAGAGWWTLFGGTQNPPSQNNNYARSPTRLAAVLTVLPEVPPASCLRPPYCGSPQERAAQSGGVMTGSQPPTYMQPWLWDASTMVPRSPSIQRPSGVQSASVSGSPGSFGLMDFWGGTWIDHLDSENCGSFCAPGDAVPTYGGEQNLLLGQTALMLCENPVHTGGMMVDLAEKAELMTRFLQYGIDTYGVVQDGKRFVGTGGHMGGRKWPVQYAGIILGNADLYGQELVVSGTSTRIFKEDAQCMVTLVQPPATPPLFTPDWQGLFYRWRNTEVTNVDYQNDYPSAPGNNWPYLRCRDENYRICCTLQGYLYIDLAVRLMVNEADPLANPWGRDAMLTWGNDAFFGCVDRFMLPMTPEVCAEYDYMQETIMVNTPGADETISGHHTGWGESKAVVGPSDYGEKMWRAMRWENHQRGVDGIKPATFRGAEFLCDYGAGLSHLRCRKPCERSLTEGCGVSAPPSPLEAARYFPTLVCDQEPRVSPTDETRLHFEVYDVPPNSWFVAYLAGNEFPVPIPFTPSSTCACTSPMPELCTAPLYVDSATAPWFGAATGGGASYFGNVNFSLTLPAGLNGSFSVQAVCVPIDPANLSNYYTTNSYAFTTIQ